MQIPVVTSAWDYLAHFVNKRLGFKRIEQSHRVSGKEDSLELQNSSSSPHEPILAAGSANPPEIGVSKQSLAAYGRWQSPGWRSGLFNCACSVIVVFVINLSVTVWGTVHGNAQQDVAFDVDCREVSKINSGLHIIINLLGTVLLASSNYCMQCLSAPTREEVNRAHAKSVWLDIGTSSLRNLKYIDKRRVAIWGLLGLSSLPLHLFYNSMVYSSIASSDYSGFLVKPTFLDDPCTDCSSTAKDLQKKAKGLGIDLHKNATELAKSMPHKTEASNWDLELLENRDCILQYANSIQTFRRNLLLIISEDKVTNDKANEDNDIEDNYTESHREFRFTASDIRNTSTSADAYDWICNREAKGLKDKYGWCLQDKDKVLNDANFWIVDGRQVRYCLSEAGSPQCKLHLLLSVGWLVTFINMIKAILMLYIVFKLHEEPLMTMGDAVASFMEHTDHTTKNIGIATRNEIKEHSRSTLDPMGQKKWKPRKWKDTNYRWYDTTSKTRRVTMFVSLFFAIIIVAIFLKTSIVSLRNIHVQTTLPALAHIGFGKIDPRTIITWHVQGTIPNIIMANLSQTFLYLLYFLYNGVFTCMLMGYEWSSFAHKRKGLRVSRAKVGAQRSTYFLQLPYRFSIPLMAVSAISHWLVSQSIFLVAVDMYDEFGKPYSSSSVIFDHGTLEGGWKSCGYSPIAIIFCLAWTFFMAVAWISLSCVPYKRGMRPVGSYSSAISAACHAEEIDGIEGSEAVRAKLKWGVVGVDSQGMGRCAFSAGAVKFPEEGKWYV